LNPGLDNLLWITVVPVVRVFVDYLPFVDVTKEYELQQTDHYFPHIRPSQNRVRRNRLCSRFGMGWYLPRRTALRASIIGSNGSGFLSGLERS
jgi:hypothetical protein